MLEIFHIPQFRSLRVVWLMEELGEDYRLTVVPFPTSDAFKDQSLMGSIPTVVDGDVVMGESIAVLQYLTSTRAIDPNTVRLTINPENKAAYAEYLQFLHLGEASLMTPLTLLARTRFGAPEQEKDGFAVGMLADLFTRRVQAVEKRLADGRPYLAGNEFTIADISVGYALAYASFRRLDQMIPVRSSAYLARLQARPAYGRAVAR